MRCNSSTCTLYCFSIGLQVATHSICKVLSFTLKPKESCSRLVTFIHHCFCSATCDSQQHISPIGFLFWNFRHRLVRYYWYYLQFFCVMMDGHWGLGKRPWRRAPSPLVVLTCVGRWKDNCIVQAIIGSDTFCLQESLTGRWGRLVIFALAILRVFSSLPAFGFIILLCGLWSLWSDVWISFWELMDLYQFNANYTFWVSHLCFDCPHKCRLSGHFCIIIFTSCNT